MTSNQTLPWESLEKWSASMLIIAGFIQLFNVILQSLPALANLSVPEIVRDLTLAMAGIVGLVGLLGLVPRLRNDVPRLARAGGVVAGLGIIGLLAVAIGEPVLGALLGNPEQPPAWFAPILILYLVGVPLSFLIFGIASWRAGTLSTGVAALLVLIFVVFLPFFQLIPLPLEGMLVQIPSMLIGLLLVATGYLLHTGTASDDSGKPSGEPTAG